MAKKLRRSASRGSVRRWQQYVFWGISFLVVLSMVLAFIIR